MANTAFDTLTVSKDLQDAGIEAKHAEAIAMAIKQGQGKLATKQDITLLKSDINQLKTELKADIDKLKSDITWIKWSMAAMIAIMLGGFSIIAS